MTEKTNEEGQKGGAQERLNSILGFDATKNNGGGVLKDALAEIQKERAEANKKKAHELVKKAIEVSEKMEEAKKQFQGAMNKSEKELNKLISSIEQLGN